MADHNSSGKGKQGFASMPRDKVKAIAARGGKASHSGRSKNKND